MEVGENERQGPVWPLRFFPACTSRQHLKTTAAVRRWPRHGEVGGVQWSSGGCTAVCSARLCLIFLRREGNWDGGFGAAWAESEAVGVVNLSVGHSSC